MCTANNCHIDIRKRQPLPGSVCLHRSLGNIFCNLLSVCKESRVLILIYEDKVYVAFTVSTKL